MSEQKIWLWLSLHFGAGSSIYQKLYNHFGSLDAIYDCDDSDVNMINWLRPDQKRKLLDKNTDHATEIIEWCNYYDIGIVTPSDEEYPYPLRSIPNYPAVLYYRGVLPDFEKELCISVVGTRNLTMEGQRNAYNLGFGLAKGGAIVVSGMAKGIDSVAQKGALYAGGSSVAVLGSGIDVVYPKENLRLMEKLAHVGAVITEYPPKTPPIGTNFPVRNRIISALSRATVVVEADLNSGALITARLAKEQDKMLFAFPGPVNSFASKGTNRLISEGAIVATEAIDVLEQFLDVFPNLDLTASKERPVIRQNNMVASNNFFEAKFYGEDKLSQNADNGKVAECVEAPVFDTTQLTDKEKVVYDFLEFKKPVSLDAISKLGMDFSELASMLTMLELKGAVEVVPGGFYIKK